MKKLLTLAVLAGSIGFGAFSAEAKTNAASAAATVAAEPQIVIQTVPNRRRAIRRIYRNNRIRRVVTQTRTIRVGRQRYRETYRTTYLPNGRTRTQIVSRVRIR